MFSKKLSSVIVSVSLVNDFSFDMQRKTKSAFVFSNSVSLVIQVITTLLKKKSVRDKISAAPCKHKKKTLEGITLHDDFYKASESFCIPPLKQKMMSLISYCRI